MFQLSCSLALVLNIIDIKELEKRKLSYNVAVISLGIICTIGSVYELFWHSQAEKEHLVFETLFLVVLCLIYFSTCVDLYRKLRIFVLEETKKESHLIVLQFVIFFLAYGSKIIVLMLWIGNPPSEHEYM